MNTCKTIFPSIVLLSVLLSAFSFLPGCNNLLPDLQLEDSDRPIDTNTDTQGSTATSTDSETWTDSTSTDDTETVTSGTDDTSGKEPSSDSETSSDSDTGSSPQDTGSATDSESESSTGPALRSAGSACSENTDCATGHCVNQVCCAAGNCCNDTTTCDGNYTCSIESYTCNDTCAPDSVDDDALCMTGFHCDSGNCIADIAGGQCNEHSDCASNQCIDSLCCEHAGLCCATDNDCPELYDGCGVNDSQTCIFSAVQLPSTSQTECWNAADEEVSCNTIAEGFDLYGQTGHYLTGARTFTLQGETVVDDTFETIWASSPSAPMNYAEADDYCDNIDLGDSTDWRLPTRTELLRLQSYSPEEANGISDLFSIPADVTQFWSSTPLAGTFSSTQWVVNFSDGSVTRLGIDSISPVALCIMEQ